ncbi:MAG: prepilin peptidase [Anaerolineae bacterium]
MSETQKSPTNPDVSAAVAEGVPPTSEITRNGRWSQARWVRAALLAVVLPAGFVVGPTLGLSVLRWPYLTVFAVVAYTDFRERRILNVVTYPAILFALGTAIGEGSWPWAVAGALAYGIVMVIPVVIYGPERAGIGDVKLALFIGLVFGLTQTLYLAVLVGAGAAAIVGVVGIIFGKLHRHSTIPFGAFMALGAAVALFQAA